MSEHPLSLPHDAVTRINMLKKQRDRTESKRNEDRSNSVNHSGGDAGENAAPETDK